MKLNWGNYIFIFILFFLTLCTIFIIFSLRQDIDLVTDNYYSEGADYTHEMEISERSDIYYDSISLSQHDGFVLLNLASSLRNSVSTLKLWFYRPSDKDKDYRVELAIKDDSLAVSTGELALGRYILYITWDKDEKEYLVKKDIFIE